MNKLSTIALSSIILFGANIYYVLVSFPSDGRWVFEVPITSFFIFIYLVLFFLTGDRIIKNPNKKFYYFITIINSITALSLLFFGRFIVRTFQDVMFAYYVFIPIFHYVIILGLSIIIYLISIFILRKRLISHN